MTIWNRRDLSAVVAAALMSQAVTGSALVVSAPAVAQEREIGPDVKVHAGLGAKYLSKPRDVLVWLPPGYASDPERYYPVLYLHDGVNAYVDWRIDETAKRLIEAGEIEPIIIVLVPNGGTAQARFEDYTPTHPANARFGGKAGEYGRFLVDEVKPLVDAQYRTLKDPAHTGLGGASLGGLVTLYLGLEHPDVFGKLAAMSPSLWWDDKLMIRKVKELKARTAAHIWLDAGELEGNPTRSDVKELRDALVKKGWTLGSDLAHYEAPGAKHNDVEFGRRADRVLKFLFPTARSADLARASSVLRRRCAPMAAVCARKSTEEHETRWLQAKAL